MWIFSFVDHIAFAPSKLGGGLLLPLVTNVIEFENRNAIILYYVLYFQRINIGITLYVRAHLGIGKKM